MKEKVYVIVGVSEDDQAVVSFRMGERKVYRKFEDAQKGMIDIIQAIRDLGCDYNAEYGENLRTAHFKFCNSPHTEDYRIYEMELVQIGP